MKKSKLVFPLLFLLLVLGVVFAPNMASTSLGKQMVLRIASKMTGKKIEASRLALSWFGNQEAEGVVFSREFRCAKVSTDAGIWRLWWHQDVGHLVVEKPILSFKVVKDATVGFTDVYTAGLIPDVRVIETPFLGYMRSLKIPYRGEITAIDGEVQFDSGLLSEIHLHLTLGKPLKVEASGMTLQGGVKGSFEVKGSLEKEVILADLQAHQFPVASLDSFFQMEGALVKNIGPEMEMEATFLSSPEAFEASLKASSPLASAEIATQSLGDTVTLKAPAKIDTPFAQVSIDQFSLPLSDRQAFSFHATAQLQTEEGPTEVVLTTENFKTGKLIAIIQGTAVASPQIEIDFNPVSSLVNFKPQGTLKAPTLSLKGVSLENVLVQFNADLKAEKGSWKGQGNIGSGILFCEGTFDPKKGLLAQGEGKSIPASFSPTSTLLIGESADFKFDVRQKSDAFFVNLNAKTPTLNLECTAEHREGFLTLLKPLKATYTLTPAAFSTFYAGDLTLGRPIQGSVSVRNLKWPTPLTDFSKIDLEGTVSIPEIAIIDTRSQAETTLKLFSIQIGQKGGKPLLSFEAKGITDPQGTLSVKGTLNRQTDALVMQGVLSKFPSAVIDIFSHDLFSSLFGKTIDATLNLEWTQWKGPLSLTIDSPTTHVSLLGAFDQGVIKLTKPLYAQTTMTPELSRLLLKSGGLFTAVRADHPLTLTVQPQGALLPVYPFSIDQLQLPSCRIELGQIVCENQGNLSKAIGILKLTDLSRERGLNLWLAPIDLQVKNGIAFCERTDILIAHAYHICLWGKIDFVKHYVDMILGLTASCLRKAFGVQELPSDYVMQIPMTGPFDQIELNTSGATAKIAALLLWQQRALAGKFGGGLLGETLKKLGPLPDLDAKAPPPKRPFPWETNPDSSEPKKKKKKTSDAKKHIHPDASPLKQMMQVLK